jgi:GH18 family chitinase
VELQLTIEAVVQETNQVTETQAAIQAGLQQTVVVDLPASQSGQIAYCSNSDPGLLVIGYLPEYQVFNPQTANCLTDIIFFSLEPTVEGHLDTSRLSPERLAKLQEARALSSVDGDLRIHLSLGGWGRNGGFPSMVVDPVLRQNFVQELDTFLRQNKFDGVDFDWEFPETEAQTQGYIDLVRETKQKLSAWGGLVTVTLYPKEEMDLMPFLTADRIHLMSYDRDTHHATFEQARDDVELFLRLGVPPEKLVLGVPFYGRETVEPYTAYTYAEIVTQHQPEPSVDEIAGVYFNGIETVQRKTCLATDLGLAGVMIWEIGQDVQPGSGLEQYSLLTAVNMAANGDCFP